MAAIGADGARSVLAAAAGRPPPNYVGQVAIRGVASFAGGVPVDCIRQVWGAGPRAGLYPISATELYFFVCFSAPADLAAPTRAADVKAEALGVVRGWGWDLESIVEATPPEELSRSRLVDRCAGCRRWWGVPASTSTPPL